MISTFAVLALLAQARPAWAEDPAETDWAARPTAEETARAYPPEAAARRISGSARLLCVVASNGALERCEASSRVAWPGFSDAALTLAPSFRLTTRAAASRRGKQLFVLVPFSAPPAATEPEPLDLPNRPEAQQKDAMRYFPALAAEREINGRVVLKCRMDAVSHRPRGCVVLEETPPEIGFGAAAVRMAEEMFRFRPLAADGTPAADRTVRIPISFKLPD